jgi:type IV secretory pathway VirJ component
MPRNAFTLVALLALTFCACAVAAEDQPKYGMFGQLHLSRPVMKVDDVILLLSDRGGWSARAEDLAQTLARRGVLVVGIDLPAYLKRLEAIGDKCSYPAGHFEELAHWVERHEGIADYINPLLLGDGSGANFAYAVVAQAPAETFSGLITLGWDWNFRLAESVCPGDAGAVTVAAGKSGYEVGAVSDLPAVWMPRPFAVGSAMRGASALLARFVSAVEAFMPLFAPASAEADIDDAYTRWSQSRAASRAPLPEDIADLPLIEVAPSGHDGGRVAVLLTGDGGWAGLDKGVAEALAGQGFRVVGFSTLKYFWQTRSPEESANALRRIVAHYAQSYPQSRFVVIGYSFGASLVPLLLNRLPAELRSRVDSGIMISPDNEAVFEIHIGDWFGGSNHDGALPVEPEIAKSSVPLACVHGEDETDSFCKPGVMPKLRVLSLPGGHHYNGEFAALGKLIVSIADKP